MNLGADKNSCISNKYMSTLYKEVNNAYAALCVFCFDVYTCSVFKIIPTVVLPIGLEQVVSIRYNNKSIVLTYKVNDCHVLLSRLEVHFG